MARRRKKPSRKHAAPRRAAPKRHHKRPQSAAQKRAFKKMRAGLARWKAGKPGASSAAPSRKSRRRPKSGSRLKPMGSGLHRPRIRIAKGKLYRPRRSHIPPGAKFANPFLADLALIGNPRKHKRRKPKMAHKTRRKSRRHSRRFRNPFANPMALARQPLAAAKELVSVPFITEAASVAAGFMLPNMIVQKLPSSFRDATWKVYASKAATVAGLSVFGSFISKRVQKAVLLGGGVSILLDAYADFLAPAIAGIGGPSAPPAKVSQFYGGPHYQGAGMAYYYGRTPGNPGMAGIAGHSNGVGSISEAFSDSDDDGGGY